MPQPRARTVQRAYCRGTLLSLFSAGEPIEGTARPATSSGQSTIMSDMLWLRWLEGPTKSARSAGMRPAHTQRVSIPSSLRSLAGTQARRRL